MTVQRSDPALKKGETTIMTVVVGVVARNGPPARNLAERVVANKHVQRGESQPRNV